MRVIWILTLLVCSFMGIAQENSWQTSYFYTYSRQEHRNWCVHACMASSFGGAQCRHVSNWLNTLNYGGKYWNCCEENLSSITNPCINCAAVPANEICDYLRRHYCVIRGQSIGLWEFLDVYPKPEVAYISNHVNGGNHLMVLLSVEKNDTANFKIRYYDPGLEEDRIVFVSSDVFVIY